MASTQPSEPVAAATVPAQLAEPEPEPEPWEYSLRKYLLLLATLVASVTYSAGFNPPGGVWQDTDLAAGHLAGDPIIRDTRYIRYTVFYYCNASAFASSLVVIVLILLLLAVARDNNQSVFITFLPLRVVMVLDLLSLMMAYAAGTCRDTFTKLYSSVLVSVVFAYLTYQVVQASLPTDDHVNVDVVPTDDQGFSDGGGNVDVVQVQAQAPGDDSVDGSNVDAVQVQAQAPGDDSVDGGNVLQVQAQPSHDSDADEVLPKRPRKVLMLLATFAVSVTYVAGLSTPGGFWQGGHRAGDAILKDHHNGRLTAFFMCNTTAFVASLLIIVLLLDKKLREKIAWYYELYGCIMLSLTSLLGAYAAGSCREAGTTAYVLGLVAAVLVCILIQLHLVDAEADTSLIPHASVIERTQSAPASVTLEVQVTNFRDEEEEVLTQLHQARSLVLLLATLAATVTYQAGLDPPGGFWEDDGEGHKAGDPILLTINPRRYKAFFYCNSVAFVASLVAIVLVQAKLLLRHHALEAAMILDLFGLIGAYAAGACRDVSTSIYVMALAGAVLVYVVIHVIFFTLDHQNDNGGTPKDNVEKRRKRLLLFAILAATITYQAGLTPPSGFVLRDKPSGDAAAGDPILLHNAPSRYEAFFYCNSVSFMLSIALILLLVNPNLYRPAIRSGALSVCTAAGLFGLMGAYAAGSTQYLSTSIHIIGLVAVVFGLIVLLVLLVVSSVNHQEPPTPSVTVQRGRQQDKKINAKRKYLMLLGILVASVTYQAGLDPPGGVWQSTGGGHDAGYPVMRDNRRIRYHIFFYCNSTSFVASIVVIVLLLVQWVKHKDKDHGWFKVMTTAIVLDLLALLGAYAAGSSRARKTSGNVVALVGAVLTYFAIHVMLALLSSRTASANPRLPATANGGLPAGLN